MRSNREYWLDHLKIFACVLVALGHFFQSMTAANIIEASHMYECFNKTIYYFHVPLFFICSGYLYQKTCEINGLSEWKDNVFRKVITLGIPYLTFSTITWLLKTIFSSSVNRQIGGLVDTLVFHPTSPYWYLYCLLFIFVITPTIKNKTYFKLVIVLSVIGKILSCSGIKAGVYAFDIVLANEIWFVLGMVLFLQRMKLSKLRISCAAVSGILFIIFSVIVYWNSVQNGFVSFVLGLLACFSCVTLFMSNVNHEKKILTSLAKYTMPIFLMHTIFAAPVRIVLMKLGVANIIVHVILGLGISFAGPIIAAEIMERYIGMDFFVYPGKYIKFKRLNS